jgi:hypothetical protein
MAGKRQHQAPTQRRASPLPLAQAQHPAAQAKPPAAQVKPAEPAAFVLGPTTPACLNGHVLILADAQATLATTFG